MTTVSALKQIASYPLRSLATSHLQTLLHGSKPFILAQSFCNMPAINRWPQESYFNPFCNQPIEMEAVPLNSPGYGERHESTLGEFLTLLSHPLPYRIYMAQFPLFERIPVLQNDVSTSLTKEILQMGEVYSTSTWIGKRSLTPLHHDPKALTNLFVQVCGRKEVRMFDPDTPRTKLKLGEGIAGNTSSVDVWSTDIPKGLEGGLQGTVEAGDGLIIPRGWWHSVRSTRDELCISVNWWFKLYNS